MTEELKLNNEINNLPGYPSLCIPRITENNINRKIIFNVLKDLKLGEIDRIDLIPKTNKKGEKYQRCFIHMKRWYKNTNAIKAKERLINGLDIKVIYENPWFWRISAFRVPLPLKN